VLVERGNGLMLSTEPAAKNAPVAHASPGARYIGALRARDDTDVSQRVDLTVRGRFDALRACAAVATDDTSWTWSGPSVDVWFDRARVDATVGPLQVTGFENDSTWVSSDPTALVGRAGVYGYDAGFKRHGVAATLSNAHVALRALYADATTRSPAATASTAPGVVGDFLGGAAADTSVYATRASFDGSDVFAFEGALQSGGSGAGIVYRREAGANPGVAADLSRNGGGALSDTYATHENRAVSSVWVTRDDIFGATLTGAYGWGSVKAHASGVARDSLAAGSAVDAASATAEVDRTFPVMRTWRGLLEAGAGDPGRLHGSARWDFTRFNVDGLRGASRADVSRVTVSAADSLREVWIALDVRYTRADYGSTPGALAIDWPELNPWLSIWDDYDPAAIVGLAYDRYNVATLTAARTWRRTAARLSASAAFRGVADEIVHTSVRAHVDSNLHGPWYASLDGRTAWYDAASWSSDGAVWSGYVEAGYRRGSVELSAGYGFDPLVFNPVTSEYADIGYTEYLRDVLAGGVDRTRADDIVRSLIAREHSLQGAGVFKVELVVDLR
ncbi:MAG TPA: hypothetical protein VFH88_13105, partial [Candidatus Krumholzibacteria bacterium]|nr:hypothetical protein [Candidatus Krumholzibacteria bacterium]